MTVLHAPQEWQIAILGDVLEVVRGASPRPKGDPRYFGGEIPWISIKDVNAQKGKYLTKTAEGVTPEGAERSRLIPTGDLILSNSASVCIPKILGVSGCIHDGFVTFPSLKKHFSVDYFFHLFNWMRPAVIEANKQGVTQVNLNTEIVRGFELPLPPLAEQRQIAARLDELLAQVDTLKARLDAIPAILKRFRQSVLAAAVSGRLTEGWRGLNKGQEIWPEFRIEELAVDNKYSLAIGPFGSNLKVSDYRDSGHPLVFVREIRANSFGDENTKFVSTDKFEELRAHRVKPGQILITKMGAPPGDIAIYPLDKPEAVITADCIKLAVNSAVALPTFIYYAMKSESFRQKIFEISAGVAQQKVSLTKFRELKISVPPIEEQTQIVHRVEQLFTFADQIEQRVRDAQARVNHLTQSILAKAFRGELTADWRSQNPELISGDNSAEALLARIRAARADLPKTKRARRRAVAE